MENDFVWIGNPWSEEVDKRLRNWPLLQGYGFGSQNPQSGSQHPVSPVSGDMTASSDLCDHMHMWKQTLIYVIKNKYFKNLKIVLYNEFESLSTTFIPLFHVPIIYFLQDQKIK